MKILLRLHEPVLMLKKIQDYINFLTEGITSKRVDLKSSRIQIRNNFLGLEEGEDTVEVVVEIMEENTVIIGVEVVTPIRLTIKYQE